MLIGTLPGLTRRTASVLSHEWGVTMVKHSSATSIREQLAKQEILPMANRPVCAACGLGFSPDPTAVRQDLCSACAAYGEAAAATATACSALRRVKPRRRGE